MRALFCFCNVSKTIAATRTAGPARYVLYPYPLTIDSPFSSYHEAAAAPERVPYGGREGHCRGAGTASRPRCNIGDRVVNTCVHLKFNSRIGSPYTTRTRLIYYALTITSTRWRVKSSFFCWMYTQTFLDYRTIFLYGTFAERKFEGSRMGKAKVYFRTPSSCNMTGPYV